ncbi:MAG: hypothetical protein WB621_24535 [Candidatus Acidiferrales bacterium]
MKLDGEYWVIRFKAKKPHLSKSGKTMVVGGTRGTKKSSVLIDGKPVYYSANAFIKRDRKGKPRPKE